MGQAQTVTNAVTDYDYKPDRETILAYSEQEFSRDISEYILKMMDNEDLREALDEATRWNRTMVEQRGNPESYRNWKNLTVAGRAMGGHIQAIGEIIFQNWLDQTAARNEQA
jgi:hypothetical protein